MALLNPKPELYCPVRRAFVSATPEEKVRQQLISEMVEALGYPLSGMAVEKALKQLPHLLHTPYRMPSRRADIVFFSQGQYPLLLIECKAVPLTALVKNQVIGYNHYVQARFVVIANATTTLHADAKNYEFLPGLPPYIALLNSLAPKLA